MIRILSVSDFIDLELTRQVEGKRLGSVDLILSCGDMPPEYLSFLRDRLDRPLFYVKGNHDIRYTEGNPMGCRNIHERIVRFRGLRIMGLEGSMWYNGGPNQYTDAQMRKIIFWTTFSLWRRRSIDIVMTHAPPRHVNDGEDLCHKGFESFNRLIAGRRPRFFVHGHVHRHFESPGDRITRVGSTSVVNTCGYTFLEVSP